VLLFLLIQDLVRRTLSLAPMVCCSTALLTLTKDSSVASANSKA